MMHLRAARHLKIVRIDLMNNRLAEDPAAAVDRMPAFPRAVQRVFGLTQDARCTRRNLTPRSSATGNPRPRPRCRSDALFCRRPAPGFRQGRAGPLDAGAALQALQASRDQGTSLHLAMRATLGAHHAEVGATLLEKWRFALPWSTPSATSTGPTCRIRE